jgi:hypothetical protein
VESSRAALRYVAPGMSSRLRSGAMTALLARRRFADSGPDDKIR